VCRAWASTMSTGPRSSGWAAHVSRSKLVAQLACCGSAVHAKGWPGLLAAAASIAAWPPAHYRPPPPMIHPISDNGFASPGTWKVWGKAMYAPFGRVYWAGTEYAYKWLGYYDGELSYRMQ